MQKQTKSKLKQPKTRDEYIHNKAHSFTALKEFKKSPEHWKHYKEEGIPDTAAFAFGRALHTFVLEPELFNDEFFIFDQSKRPEPDKSFASAKNKAWKSEQYTMAEKEGKQYLSDADFEKIQRMRDKLFMNGPSRELLEFTRKEHEVAKVWKRNGALCKSLEDISGKEFGADLKTTGSADPEDFMRSMFYYDYYIQAGMYTDGYYNGHAPLYDLDRDFYFIVIEKEAPFGVSVIRMSHEYLQKGIEEYRDLVTQLEACIEADVWESYNFKAPIDTNGVFDAFTPYQLRD